MITGYDLDETSKPEFCKVCTEAKMSQKPFPKVSTGEKAIAYGDKVVCGLWGPARVKALSGEHYMMNFQDKYTHEENVKFLKHKSEAFDNYRDYEAWVKAQRKVTTIKVFGTDHGGEFIDKESKAYL